MTADRAADRSGARDDEPTLPDRSRDDSDVGWGDEDRERSGGRDDDWYLRERPPHHGD